jgi:cyclase
VARAVDIPVIASGGVATAVHVVDVLENPEVSAVALARALHMDKMTFAELRDACRQRGIAVRDVDLEMVA